MVGYWNFDNLLSKLCWVGILVKNVTASGDDGNVPANAVDGDTTTRWSNYGVGSWIQLEFYKIETICQVWIHWYKGYERKYHFVLEISENGTSYMNLPSIQVSSGTSTGYEKYRGGSNAKAKYLRVTVNGFTKTDNTTGEWASINEIWPHKLVFS